MKDVDERLQRERKFDERRKKREQILDDQEEELEDLLPSSILHKVLKYD